MAHELSPTLQSDDYEILNGHYRADNTFKSSAELRQEYISLTDKLVDAAVNGVPIYDKEQKKVNLRKPDTFIFLDKSARPLAWMFSEFWDKLAQDIHTGEIPPKPDIKFLNIDKDDWSEYDGQSIAEIASRYSADDEIIRSLRSIFVLPEHRRGGIDNAINNAPTLLDGKVVVIVDEVKSSGMTLEIAKSFLRKAVPSAFISGLHWMDRMTKASDKVSNADVPVWYDDKSKHGRGVGDKDVQKSSLSKSQTQRLGRWFLSTPFDGGDPQAAKLRSDIKRLANDPNVPIIPYNLREDYAERKNFYHS